MNINIGIVGLGFVGNAIYNSFKKNNINVFGYDKYKNSDSLEECILCNIIFLCLPTLFDNINNCYDLSSIIDICSILNDKYKGIVIIKSTIEPNTINNLQNKYTNIKLIHNPQLNLNQ